MLDVLIPSNVAYFLSFIVDIANFQIIPTETILAKVTTISDETDSSLSPGFQSAGIKSTNMI